MAGFIILPRSKEICHCLTKTGLGAMSQVGIERNDMLSMLPVEVVRAIRSRGAAPPLCLRWGMLPTGAEC